MTRLHTHLPLQASEHLVLSKSVWRVRRRKFSRDWEYALNSFRKIGSRRALFGPGYLLISSRHPNLYPTGELRAGYTGTSWQEHCFATKGSHVTRGRKWRYSSNANVGSQPLKVLWKHDTGKAALLSFLIQSLTNGSKEGEERGGHYKKLLKDFCSSSNPFVRNMSKCKHSHAYKQKDKQLSSGYFHPSNFSEGPYTFKGNKISSHREEIYMH